MIHRLVLLAITGYFTLCAVAVVGYGAYWTEQEFQPTQPIAFSHARHAGELKIECTHCHRYADKGRQATVPPMSVCGDCHSEMQSDNPQVKALQKYLAAEKPVPWVKVHRLPWHVHFTHKRHIWAGIDCTNCHGPIQGMAEVRQFSSLKMGWCVNCHRMKQASTDCWTCHK